MRIATIIVTYNGERWINKTLDSLSRSTIPTDIIVIDNCSTDSTRELLCTYDQPITFIKSDANLGFGGANNIGFEKARQNKYDYYFLLNQDAWIEPNCLEEMIKIAQQKGSKGIISPLHLNGKGNNFDAGFAYYIGQTWNDLDKLQREELLTAPFINAALWLIPAQILEEIGGFDPLFYHYGEDVDWVNRLKYHGYSVYIATKAIGYHDRDDRPKSSKIDMKAEYIAHLVELKNPNYPLVKAFLMGAVAPLKKGVLSPSYFSKYCTLSIKLIKMLPTVYNNRVQTQKRRRS